MMDTLNLNMKAPTGVFRKFHGKELDLVYLHNAFEAHHDMKSGQEFLQHLLEAFRVLEQFRREQKICYYGMATWTCFRVPQNSKQYLSLEQVVKVAERAGGENHGFRFIQLPYNLDYPEAYILKNQPVGSERYTILEAASLLGVKVFTSAPFLHGHLLKANVPDYDHTIGDQVLKLVQIIRSTPSIIAPIIGQKDPRHLENNMKIAYEEPMDDSEFTTEARELFKLNSPFSYLLNSLNEQERNRLNELMQTEFSLIEALVAIKVLQSPYTCITCGNIFRGLEQHSREVIEDHMRKHCRDDDLI
jgi:hypothetical protein